ncbi:MAG TPA: glycoside hydrolase family 16 protein [Arthrobacter sp.]|nr:glycoside hydrolase family 16 protein [Arthrobacter sp.]
MSASKDQACAQTRRHSVKSPSPLKRAAIALKRPRNASLAAGAVAALVGIASLGPAAGTGPAHAQTGQLAQTAVQAQSSLKADQAPGHNKPTAVPLDPIETVAPAPEPAPVETAPTTTADPAPAPVAEPAPAPAMALASTSTPAPVGVSGNWTMAFSDEFDGSALDTSKWSNCWFSPTCGTMNKVSTSPANVAVANGNLALTLASSTSGALVSSNPKGGAGTGYQFTTGYVEARIKFPGNANGLYNWPAFWSTGQSWPATGENDIAEVLSGKMTVNYHSSSGAHNQGTVPGNWANEYHTFGLHRKATSSDVYFDGVLVKSYPTDDGNAPQYLVLNVGNSSANPVYGPASQVSVDYVRAWQ